MTVEFRDGTTVQAAAEPVSTDVEGEAVILHPGTGQYHGLNAVGTEIWGRLDDPATVADLAAAVAEAHDESADRVRPDVEAFLADLHAADLIRVDGRPP